MSFRFRAHEMTVICVFPDCFFHEMNGRQGNELPLQKKDPPVRKPESADISVHFVSFLFTGIQIAL